MVSLLALPLDDSTVGRDDLRGISSGGRDGEVIMSEGPSPASASSLRSADPRMGDEPERVRRGILVNLIRLAGLWLDQFAGRGAGCWPTFASHLHHRSHR